MLKILIYILFFFAINFSNSNQYNPLSQIKNQNIETIIYADFSTNFQNDFFDNNPDDESSKLHNLISKNCKSQILFSLVSDFHHSDIHLSNSILLDFYTDLPPPVVV